jgi:UDPglucose 6-dehydrogenase
MKICVLGLWHLGSVTAACLASVGHDVVGLDLDSETTLKGLRLGKAPIFEPGLDNLIQNGLTSGHLRFSSAPNDACSNVEVLWITYDTPVDEDDIADIEYVTSRIETVLPNLSRATTVLVSSQMPVGSIKKLEAIARSKYPELDLSFAYSPENLRLGKSLEVFLKPDRIVVGTRTERDKERLEKMFFLVSNRIEWMSVESAEMTKHAINAFLATSVTFANEIASVCESVGADAKEVERGLKSEERIGPKAYLSPGGAFAGGTLARDINFLTQIGKAKGLRTPLLSAVKPSNDEHKNWVRRRLLSAFPKLDGLTIAVWGLTYKPGTDTLRRSLAVELCEWLLQQGVKLRVHDPIVVNLPTHWAKQVTHCSTPLETLTRAVALIVATEWPQYKDISAEDIADIQKGLLVLDANRFLKKLVSVENLQYVAVGTPLGVYS